MDLTAKDTVFGRGEIAGKTPSELALPTNTEEVFTLGKLQAGYTRWLHGTHGVRFGVGGSAGMSIVPEGLATFYGGHIGGEFAVFLTVRPH